MRKKSHGRILRKEPKKQHLNTVPKSCSISYEPYKHVNQENFTHNKKDTTKGGIAVTETTSLIRRR